MPQPTYLIDFDSTLVTVESLDELASVALAGRPDRERVMNELRHVTDLGMTGAIDFRESLDRRLKLFSADRAQVEALVTLLSQRISPSALARRDWFQKNAGSVHVISGGFEDYILPVAKRLGIPASHVFANRFLYDRQGKITGYDKSRPTSQAGGKAKQATVLNLQGQVIVIGDGHTDYELKARGVAQEFWAFTETIRRENVVAKADRVLESFMDLD